MAGAESTIEAQGKVRAAALCGFVAIGIAMALAVLLVPGKPGGAIVRACAAAGFGLLLFVLERTEEGDFSALRKPNGEPTSQALLAGACWAAVGLAGTLASGQLLVLTDDARYLTGIAGFIASAFALAAWAKSHRKSAVRASLEDPGPDRPALAVDIASAVVVACGLALCFGTRLTPLANVEMHALVTGVLVAGALTATGAWLLHTPRLAREIDALHEMLESETTEKAAAQSMLNRVSANYTSLKTRHKNEMAAKKKLAAEIEQLMESQPPLPPKELDEACDNVANEFNLSKRESQVLNHLAYGRSRKRIADELRLELSTVNSHIARVYRKLDIHSNQELIDLVEKHR